MTTQPHPEPSEEASSLTVVAWLDEAMSWFSLSPSEAAWPLVRLSDAQSQLNAMRVERDAARAACASNAAHAEAMCRQRDEVRAELHDVRAAFEGARAIIAALKAAPAVDVERIMALAEDLEAEAVYATRSGNLDRVRAAREALRAAVEARP